MRNGDAFPGIVTDDTGIFTAARRHGLAVEAFDVLLPEPAFQFFVAALGNEKQQSQYSYGFPDGDGDCNCVTWSERLRLPLLTGRERMGTCLILRVWGRGIWGRRVRGRA